jgi:hypothetical protein
MQKKKKQQQHIYMQNEYKIIQYLSNSKIYKHNSFIYLHLSRLSDDLGLSIA